MKTDTTKDVWVDVSGLPRDKNGGISWSNSIGLKVSFKYNEVSGEFVIIDYIKKNKRLFIKYQNKPELEINSDNFLNCFFARYVGVKYRETQWTFEINQSLKNNNRDIIITNRKLENEVQYYQYKCNICGFDSKCCYDTRGDYRDDFWISAPNLLNGNGCACCSNHIVVPGINDITTTDPWMIKFFQGDSAKKYTSCSSKKIYPICPDCGKVKSTQVIISNIYKRHSIGCTCSDKISYPNKFSYALLEQLPIENWETEYQPDWLKPYFFDNYFEYNNQGYVLEMDGGLGHGNRDLDNNKDKIGIQRDIIKDNLALQHDIKVIRIDCIKSDMEYIKNNILNSNLNYIFDLSCIDWLECDKNGLKNIVKEVCLFWEGNGCPSSPYQIVKDKFHIKASWTIIKYLKSGTKHGWCNYSVDKYKKTTKTFNMYDSNHKFIGTYTGLQQFSKTSLELFGVYLESKGISDTCNNKRQEYKGYIFEWTNKN